MKYRLHEIPVKIIFLFFTEIFFLNLKIYRKVLKALDSQINYEQKEYDKNFYNI